jgi:hypothetical protein
MTSGVKLYYVCISKPIKQRYCDMVSTKGSHCIIIVLHILIFTFVDSRQEDKRFCPEWYQAVPEFSELFGGSPCHHGVVHPWVVDGGDGLQIWRVAANILNKQLWTADKGCSSSLGVGRWANNSSP